MKISGLWEYEKLEQQCISMKHTMAFMAESIEMIADMNFELGRELVEEKEDAIQELRNEAVLIKTIKKHKQIEQERYDRLQQMRYELKKTRQELIRLRGENAALEEENHQLEEMTGVRWGYNFARGEWWPMEGTIKQIARRIPLPLQEITADDKAEAAN